MECLLSVNGYELSVFALKKFFFILLSVLCERVFFFGMFGMFSRFVHNQRYGTSVFGVHTVGADNVCSKMRPAREAQREGGERKKTNEETISNTDTGEKRLHRGSSIESLKSLENCGNRAKRQ